MPAMLRRGGDQIGTFLWLFASVDQCDSPLPLKAAAVGQLASALAAADVDAIDQQLRQLQGGGGGASASAGASFSCRQMAFFFCWEALRLAKRCFAEAR